MRFPDEWIDLVKSSVDIVDVIGKTVQLRQTGRNYVGLCPPFHDERHHPLPSIGKNSSSIVLAATRGGNVFNFIMETQHVSFPEAVSMLAQEQGLAVPAQSAQDRKREEKREQLRKINEEAARYYYRNLRQGPGLAARRYLEQRGITEELAREFYLAMHCRVGMAWFVFGSKNIDLQSAEEAGLISLGRQGYIDRFRDRILFPICDHLGRFIGFGGRAMNPQQPKYLNTAQTAVFDKSSVLYGLNWSKDAIKSQDQVIIVEGYTDLIALFSVGRQNVVASLGTAFTPRHARLLARFSKRAIIALTETPPAGGRY